jgi:hypothetical protein
MGPANEDLGCADRADAGQVEPRSGAICWARAAGSISRSFASGRNRHRTKQHEWIVRTVIEILENRAIHQVSGVEPTRHQNSRLRLGPRPTVGGTKLFRVGKGDTSSSRGRGDVPGDPGHARAGPLSTARPRDPQAAPATTAETPEGQLVLL